MTILLIKMVPNLIWVFLDILINTQTASLDAAASVGNCRLTVDELDGDDQNDNNFTTFV